MEEDKIATLSMSIFARWIFPLLGLYQLTVSEVVAKRPSTTDWTGPSEPAETSEKRLLLSSSSSSSDGSEDPRGSPEEVCDNNGSVNEESEAFAADEDEENADETS
jgi:hypothetical protein